MRFIKILIISSLIAFTLSACERAPKTPEAIAKAYWTAMQAGEFDKANTFAIELDLERLKKKGKSEAQFDMEFEPVEIPENAQTIKVPTKFTTKNEKTAPSLEFDTVMNLTTSGWKVNSEKSKDAMFMAVSSGMGDVFTNALKNSGKALQEGMKAFSETLKKGSPAQQ